MNGSCVISHVCYTDINNNEQGESEMKTSTREFSNTFNEAYDYYLRHGKFTVTVVAVRHSGKTFWNLSINSASGRREPVDLVEGKAGKDAVKKQLAFIGRKFSDLNAVSAV